MNRLILTLGILIGAAALLVIFANTLGDRQGPPPDALPAVTEQADDSPDADETPGAVDASDSTDGAQVTSQPATDDAGTPPVADQPTSPLQVVEPAAPVQAQTASEPPIELPPLMVIDPGKQPEPVIGSTEPPAAAPSEEQANSYLFEARFSPWSAGLIHLRLRDYSEKVDERIPYTVQEKLFYRNTADGMPTYRYPLGSHAIQINNQRFDLRYARWKLTTPADPAENGGEARFELTFARASDQQPVLRLVRVYRVRPIENNYELELTQYAENLSDLPITIRYEQFAQGDLPWKTGYMGDRRKVAMGYFRPEYDAPRRIVFTRGFDMLRSEVIKADERVIWPDRNADEPRELVWSALSNRYFTAAVHRPVIRNGDAADGEAPVKLRVLDETYPVVSRSVLDPSGQENLLLVLSSRAMKMEPGGRADLSLVMFAGPKAPEVIDEDPVYTAMGLHKLIVYNLGGCCSALTFSWLAEFLMWFLKIIHALTFDWGLAIMLLVVVVRGILHPLTRKSQLNMMKMSKQMAAIQPEMERLKKKYKDNQSRLNQEIMKLYRDRGVNPAAMGLGCLPMFLQMPIWIALYAMLYYAIELRHEPAFWGVFQWISGGHWLFLADLSSPDSFLPLPGGGFTIPVVGWNVDAVNILPILMAVVFFFQQKFMSPPQTGEMSDQQKQQQMIMKFTVLLFPIMLYKAPSGLTLYILASTAAGILDSYMVRKHLKELEASGKLFEVKPRKPGGFMERMQKRLDEVNQRRGKA